MRKSKKRTVPLAEAKAKLSELIREVEAGGEIEITKGGAKVARLCSVRPLDVPLLGFLPGIVMQDDLIRSAVSPEDWELV